jgi:hypothetical protein
VVEALQMQENRSPEALGHRKSEVKLDAILKGAAGINSVRLCEISVP